ncbi:Hypothetical Protein FCC1311_078682 [Hondaea fermentalgiana]|uniref:Uncharacterized protein n=1 Tax=Hondaea fermentalgiana TaxID=2315210 RepID=A0A2R5GSL8_9STRA|nr:Hypothetical Protein FCC1311_078682 [Hondaea fermentalgiana]|eukprot:GBG31643.1 Hypothetical Protein FCC1311_078682 [Hondaea fermentalgiana]
MAQGRGDLGDGESDPGASEVESASAGRMPYVLLRGALMLSVIWVMVIISADIDPLSVSLRPHGDRLPLLGANDAPLGEADEKAVASSMDNQAQEIDANEPGQAPENQALHVDAEGFDIFQLAIDSPFPKPVIFVRVSGSWCNANALEWKRVFLSDGMTLGIENMEVVKRKRKSASHWKLRYQIALKAPCPGETHVFWRLEYSSLKDALADYPAPRRSFIGAPSGTGVISIAPPSGLEDPVSQLEADNTWLVRKADQRSWQWPSTARRKCALRDKLPVTVIGDSQPSYMCAQWRSHRPNVFCELVKGPLNNHSIVEKYVAVLDNADRGGALVINAAGLWEAALGTISLYRTRIREILDAAMRASFEHVFYITTTMVHPIHYAGLYNDSRKWAMTAPRVHELNNEAIALLSTPAYANRVHVIDLESLSLGSEDDPMTATDMRHFGDITNEALAHHLSCAMIDAEPSLRRPMWTSRHVATIASERARSSSSHPEGSFSP